MKQGIDQGFELLYWKLSHRRKLIRTLWITPLMLLPFFLPPDQELLGVPRQGFFWIFVAVLISQAVYNYRKWKKQERSPLGTKTQKPRNGT
jgi:hypothetical protein